MNFRRKLITMVPVMIIAALAIALVAVPAGAINQLPAQPGVGTGTATGGDTTRPVIPAVSAGNSYTVGLKSDGTVVSVGGNYYGQCDVGTWSQMTSPTMHDLEGVWGTGHNDVFAVGYMTGGPYYGSILHYPAIPPCLCGDVNDDDKVNMADVMILWYDIAEYASAGAWNISNEWAADVNCDGKVNMADVMILWYDIADYPSAGAWEINCCE